MALWSDTWGQLLGIFTSTQVLTATITLIGAYYLAHAIYCINFHPLSKYPGPKLAAFSNVWWAYSSTSGRYPWIIASVLRRYGDVVRIAPNELVFLTPRAAKDIYLAQEKNLELFVQVGYDALDTGDNGISGEPDPIKHREIAKKLAPAFSTRNLKAKEATVNKHFDFFIKKMKSLGTDKKGVDMRSWSDWLALDLSMDMTYGRDMGQMRDMKDSILLNTTPKLNLFAAVSQLTRKLRLFTVLQYLTIPPSVWLALPKLIKLNSEDVRERIERRDQIEHLDYFEQVLLASWQPLANQFCSLIIFLLKEPDAYTALVEEIRGVFVEYGAIDMEAVASLKYLNGCVQESLRLHQETTDGLPRVSPGAVVDGEYIPQGVICRTSLFTYSRSERYFHDAKSFRPQRWLCEGHPMYDSKFSGDDKSAHMPFIMGPRQCPGREVARIMFRLVIAKTIWLFDMEQTSKRLEFERDFTAYGMWMKPEFRVRLSRARGESKQA
ncbi:cytochrome P450 [Amniculicola lignicola CBS 123094]|uniref:Cytochrome P450 n=1 Tax=Amniculicola lignicola CBS 123094 TaxID=1392246 RepID=A0A6A5VTR5_9PLEO|nr:cytochrome P450 [Amniculicola lignicola CBS 123094]